MQHRVTVLFLLLAAGAVLGLSYGSSGLRSPLVFDTVGVLRASRTVVALGVGAMLGVAGALLQYSVSNPLAEPSLLGMPQAGMLAVGVAVLVLGGLPPGSGYLVAALGALGGYGASLLLASRLGLSGPGLVVAGVAVSSAATGAGMLVLMLAEQKLGLPGYVLLFGSFAYATPGDAAAAALGAVFSVAAGAALARGLDALSYGDETAAAAGFSPGRVRLAATLVAAVATAVSINVAGVIGFVGLVAPNLARLLGGSHPGVALPLSAVAGGVLGVWADLFSRISAGVVGLGELPAGAGTSLAGGLFLAYLVLRRPAPWGVAA